MSVKILVSLLAWSISIMVYSAPALAQEKPSGDRSTLRTGAGEKFLDSRIDNRRIQDILELQRLKGIFFYYLDHKNWDAWRSLMTQDYTLTVDGRDGKADVIEGRDKAMAYVKERLAVTPSVHQGYSPFFEFTSATEASGIWAMSDLIFSNPEKPGGGYGHYHDTYRKENGIWKISSLHLTRLKGTRK